MDGDLSSKMSEMSLESIFKRYRSVLEGTKQLHSKGYVHRDLKEENILIKGEETKIADFEICFQANDFRDRLTNAEESVGPWSLTAPELKDGKGEVTPKCDIYSLGKMLYGMLSGRQKGLGSDIFEMDRHAIREIRNEFDLSAFNPYFQATICLRNDRLPDIDSMIMFFERCLSRAKDLKGYSEEMMLLEFGDRIIEFEGDILVFNQFSRFYSLEDFTELNTEYGKAYIDLLRETARFFLVRKVICAAELRAFPRNILMKFGFFDLGQLLEHLHNMEEGQDHRLSSLDKINIGKAALGYPVRHWDSGENSAWHVATEMFAKGIEEKRLDEQKFGEIVKLLLSNGEQAPYLRSLQLNRRNLHEFLSHWFHGRAITYDDSLDGLLNLLTSLNWTFKDLNDELTSLYDRAQDSFEGNADMVQACKKVLSKRYSEFQ